MMISYRAHRGIVCVRKIALRGARPRRMIESKLLETWRQQRRRGDVCVLAANSESTVVVQGKATVWGSWLRRTQTQLVFLTVLIIHWRLGFSKKFLQTSNCIRIETVLGFFFKLKFQSRLKSWKIKFVEIECFWKWKKWHFDFDFLLLVVLLFITQFH